MYKKSRMELGCANMTVEDKNRICGMHKKSRMELDCTIINVDCESLIRGMNKNRELSKVELGSTIMTVDTDSTVFGIQKKSRMQIGAATVTPQCHSKICGRHGKPQISASIFKNDY